MSEIEPTTDPEAEARKERASALLDKLMGALENELGKENIAASKLEVVRRFLHDNGIQAGRPNQKRARGWLKKLPFTEEEERAS